MVVIKPRELLLEYLTEVESVESRKLLTDLSAVCGEIGENDIYTPVDFSSFGEYPESDVLEQELWGLQTSGAIEEHPTLNYKITERGGKLLEKYQNRRSSDEIDTWSLVNDTIKTVLDKSWVASL